MDINFLLVVHHTNWKRKASIASSFALSFFRTKVVIVRGIIVDICKQDGKRRNWEYMMYLRLFLFSKFPPLEHNISPLEFLKS
jgi:hypothetical protein